MWRGVQASIAGGDRASSTRERAGRSGTRNMTVYNIENLHTNDISSLPRDVKRAGVAPSKSQMKSEAGSFFDDY
jgi:hypothetical protein